MALNAFYPLRSVGKLRFAEPLPRLAQTCPNLAEILMLWCKNISKWNWQERKKWQRHLLLELCSEIQVSIFYNVYLLSDRHLLPTKILMVDTPAQRLTVLNRFYLQICWWCFNIIFTPGFEDSLDPFSGGYKNSLIHSQILAAKFDADYNSMSDGCRRSIFTVEWF